MTILIKETGHKNEKTLVIVKPDGVQRGLTGEIIRRFERVGLKLVGIKLMVPNKELIHSHYTTDDGWFEKVGQKSIKAYTDRGAIPPFNDPAEMGRRILDRLTHFMSSGPVVAMVWQGAHAVAVVRKITGGMEAFTSDVGTIRSDYVLDSYEMADSQDRAIRNVIHASSSIDDAQSEISKWFKAEEIVDYKAIHEQILYQDFSDLLGK